MTTVHAFQDSAGGQQPKHMRSALFAFLVLSLYFVDNVQAEIEFRCPTQLVTLQQQVPDYLHQLGIDTNQFQMIADSKAGVLTLALNTAPDDTLTLDFSQRTSFDLKPERVQLPAGARTTRTILTVSKKEIALALLQHGRITEFEDDACSAEALKNEVGVRQNTVAWAQNIDWGWPDGRSAHWNAKYWHHGTPKSGVSLQAAVMDAFLRQDKYTIGCYTATKLVIVQGMLDYFHRVAQDPLRTRRIESALLEDAEPLVGIEPGVMWSFEPDFDPRDSGRPGKLVELHFNVAPDNFVPGDWVYLLNTDTKTYQKTGYEGSNALYLGGNRFDDYFNDHGHSYTYEEKLDEVYQWRHGVFSRARDKRKIKPLTKADFLRLAKPPSSGGIQLDFRGVPKHF